MKLSQINTISFNGKIIDAHAHYGHWSNNQRYFGHNELDVFLKNPLKVKIDGIDFQDNIEKMKLQFKNGSSTIICFSDFQMQ